MFWHPFYCRLNLVKIELVRALKESIEFSGCLKNRLMASPLSVSLNMWQRVASSLCVVSDLLETVQVSKQVSVPIVCGIFYVLKFVDRTECGIRARPGLAVRN